MANFTGYQPQAVPRFGSKVQWDDPTLLAFGLASSARNVRYFGQSIATRYGKKRLLTLAGPVGGLGVLRYLSPSNTGQSNVSIVASTQNDGNLWIGSPWSQASLKKLTTAEFLATANVALQAGLFTQFCQAYNRMMAAQSDLMRGSMPPLIIDGATQAIDPASDLPFGAPWSPDQAYRKGHAVTATNQNGAVAGMLFIATNPGTSGNSEPAWPTGDGQTVQDGPAEGGVLWEKFSITVTSGLPSPMAPTVAGTAADVNSSIAPGMTVFLVCTWTNQYGESLASIVNPDGTLSASVLQWTNNTGGAVDLNVLLLAVSPQMAQLAGQYQATGSNVYAFFCAGAPVAAQYTDPTYYALVGSYAIGQQITLSAYPTGATPAAENTAYTTPAGNVSSGTRYMIVLYQTRTGYICGVGGPVPISCDISLDGRKMLVQGLPLGPYNCVARICAFTVAGQSSAGPYYYIYQDDYVDPGEGEAKILQTATLINDNVTTTAYFDFIDTYLEGASDVTDFFNRIQIPACTDIYFSKKLNRVIYTGAEGFPSTFLVGDLEDPEGIEVPGSNLDVAPEDGDRCICWRELREIQIGFKENSAHAITPDDGNPTDWESEPLWTGVGPCGPRALDVFTADLSPGYAGNAFIALAHRSGAFVWQSGAPQFVGREILEDWESINWRAASVIRVCIDPIHREIRFHVPAGNSTTNNKTYTVNYFMGFEEPIIFSVRAHAWIPNPNGRKWSVDDIAASDACYMPQRYA
jgi:hypothetical protein